MPRGAARKREGADAADNGVDAPRGATPLRRQYLAVKARHPDAIVLFRLGDFYETFDEDARTTAAELDIVLTGRDMGKGQRVPMAGVPAHALEGYLARLIRRGYKVAICEQITEPTPGSGLVERDVVRVVTPGTVIEPGLLDERANNFIAAVVLQDDTAGIAYADITTAEFAAAQLPLLTLPLELARLGPAELIVPEELDAAGVLGALDTAPGDAAPPAVTATPEAQFRLPTARRTLLSHFGVQTLEAYGCEDAPLAARAAGGLLAYLQDTQRGQVAQLTGLRTYSPERHMVLDHQTRRNLELFSAGRFGGGKSLVSVLDHTRTPMGARLLRRWLGQPLLDREALEERLEAVDWFHAGSIRREHAAELLSRMGDLERLVNRITTGAALPRELVALRTTLEAVPALSALLEEGGDALAGLREGLHPCEDVTAVIAQAVSDDATALGAQGGVVRPGFSEELDTLRSASTDARAYIAGLERQERERTGIASLRVGYNKVFGYYLEVSNANLSRAPEDYVRRQTLVNAERFITPELKEYEALILNAEERLGELESAIFRQVCRQVAAEAPRILETAAAVAQADVFRGLAEAASRNGYVRPAFTDDGALEVTAGRHPVVEQVVGAGAFVPNDTALGLPGASLMVLTGPNMAGKSTYIRQVALIVLMAQVGSFVPADTARMGVVDRIFTRVGLQDDLATGQSTFMVEMVETASILHHATERSLVVLDEIGRGTSTYDGLAIARAVAEYLHSHPRLGCKTLFATHYHELTALADALPNAVNHNVSAVETDGQVTFLHRIVPGGADRSYGVHVARLAGLPPTLLHRASELLAELEAEREAPRRAGGRPRSQPSAAAQLPLLSTPDDGLADEVLRLDVSEMTPLEALNKLYHLQQQAREARGG